MKKNVLTEYFLFLFMNRDLLLKDRTSLEKVISPIALHVSRKLKSFAFYFWIEKLNDKHEKSSISCPNVSKHMQDWPWVSDKDFSLVGPDPWLYYWWDRNCPPITPHIVRVWNNNQEVTLSDDNHIYQWDNCLSFKGQKWIKTPAYFSSVLEIFDLNESSRKPRDNFNLKLSLL